MILVMADCQGSIQRLLRWIGDLAIDEDDLLVDLSCLQRPPRLYIFKTPIYWHQHTQELSVMDSTRGAKAEVGSFDAGPPLTDWAMLNP